MPIYNFECNNCSHEFEQQHTIAKRDTPLKEPCPVCYHIGYIKRVIASPNLGDPFKLETTKGLQKPSNEFNDRLREIKKKYPKNKILITR